MELVLSGGAVPSDSRSASPAERERPPCLCERYARVTERAALAGARWLGRADDEGAEEAACSGDARALEELPINGRIVIGAAEDEGLLPVGATSAPAARRSTSRSTRSRGAASSRAAATARCR